MVGDRQMGLWPPQGAPRFAECDKALRAADFVQDMPVDIEQRLAVSQTKMAMESTAAHASWIGDCLLQYDRVVTTEEIRAEWEKVTVEEVQAIAAEVLDESRLALAEILPD